MVSMKKTHKHKPKLWISLLEIHNQSKDKRIKYKKGFTNGVVMAVSKRDAIDKFRKSLLDMGYKLIYEEDTEEFDKRCLKFSVAKEVQNAAFAARRKRIPQFSTFCLYRDKRRIKS